MRDHRQSIVFLTVIGVFLHHFLNYELLDKLRAAFLKNVDLMQLDEIMVQYILKNDLKVITFGVHFQDRHTA